MNKQLWHEGSVNRYLLCTVLSKQARRLGRLIPEMRIAELIEVALRNCTDHEVEIQMDGDVPEAIRAEAARMFPPSKLLETVLAASPGSSRGSQTENRVLAMKLQEGTEDRSTNGESSLSEAATDIQVAVGTGVDSPDSCGNVHDFPKD
jgi:hypothetical protein